MALLVYPTKNCSRTKTLAADIIRQHLPISQTMQTQFHMLGYQVLTSQQLTQKMNYRYRPINSFYSYALGMSAHLTHN